MSGDGLFKRKHVVFEHGKPENGNPKSSHDEEKKNETLERKRREEENKTYRTHQCLLSTFFFEFQKAIRLAILSPS